MKSRMQGGFSASLSLVGVVCPKIATGRGSEFRPVPACASINLGRNQLVGAGLALAVVAAVAGAAAVVVAGVVAVLNRESRG